MKIQIALLVAFLFVAIRSNAEDAAVLKGLPTTDQVLNTIKGKDLKETYQKQVGALKILFQMVTYDELINPYRPENARILAPYKDRYNKGIGAVYALYSKNIRSLENADEKRALFNASESYLNNEVFRREVISKLLQPRTQKVYYDKRNAARLEQKNRDDAKRYSEQRQKKQEDYRYNYKFIDKGVKPAIGGLIIIFIGILMWRPANRTIHKNNAAKFEGRLEGISYKDALKFDRSQKWAVLRVRLAFIIWIIGICVLLMGVSSIVDYYD